MSRIDIPKTIDEAPLASRPLLASVKASFGTLPNVFRLLSTSPAALKGLLDLSATLSAGSLDPATRERIALTVANVNGCDYCNAAHTVGAKLAKLGPAEIEAARRGRSEDPIADVGLRFVRKVALERGQVSDEDIAILKDAGYSDAQIVELVLHVALNTLTNYVNEVFETPIDFPATEPALRAA